MTYSLLLTSCIRPNSETLVKHQIQRHDAATRLQDYLKALDFWLGQNFLDHLIYIDNSDYPLDVIGDFIKHRNHRNIRIEIFQMEPQPIPGGFHYGYAEKEMMDYALTNSQWLDPDTTIIKCTGRLYFPSVKKLIAWNKDYDFIGDCRDYRIWNWESHYMTTTLLLFRKNFYMQYLYQKWDIKYSHLESVLFDIIKPLVIQSEKIKIRFPFNIQPAGYAAHWNSAYHHPKRLIANFIRGIIRRIAPSWHL